MRILRKCTILIVMAAILARMGWLQLETLSNLWSLMMQRVQKNLLD